MLTLDDVAEYLDEWHKYDGYGMCICVYHEDKNPSMMVTSHGYRCKSCLAHGSLEKLYSDVSGRVVEHKKVFNQSALLWMKWEEKFGSLQTIAKIAHANLMENSLNQSYLKERKLETQIKAGNFGYLEGYYTFPIKNEYDELCGIVARASPTIQTKNNRYTVSKGCPEKLYVPSWNRVLGDSAYLYVCYGTLDVWTLHMAGYAGITGISGQELSFANLDRFRKPMYIIPDRGEEKSAMELQSRLNWRGMPLYLNFPEGTKDLNSVHQKYGLDTVSKLIEQAKGKYNYD